MKSKRLGRHRFDAARRAGAGASPVRRRGRHPGYLATVSGAARAKSNAYFEGGYRLLLWSFLVGAAVNLAFLHFGWAARLSAWARRRIERKFLIALLFAAPFLVGSFVLALPWMVYTQFAREHRYGLASQNFVRWFGEQLIGRRWGGRGVTDIANPAVVPVASIVISAFFLVATPLTNTLVRVHEAEAGIFGLNGARAPDGFAQTALRLSADRKLEPRPLEEALFYDHPGRGRIAMSMRWTAEHSGEPGLG